MAEIIQFIPTIVSGNGICDQLRALTTTQLKHMWDDPRRTGAWDGMCDEIHMVMNERGEGDYVAV